MDCPPLNPSSSRDALRESFDELTLDGDPGANRPPPLSPLVYINDPSGDVAHDLPAAGRIP